MKIDGFLSLKDYFNYYISGFVWICDLLSLGILLFSSASYQDSLKLLDTAIANIDAILVGLLVVLLPYIVGFLLFPMSQFLRRRWMGEDGQLFPNPRKWLIIKSEDLQEYKDLKKPLLKGSRLSNIEIKQLLALAEKRFGLKYKTNINLIFYPIRTYLLEFGGESANFAQRMRDLMSLTESLLLPVSVLAGLLICGSVKDYWKLVAIPVFILIQWLMAYRYHRLEIDWVKRVYRGFLAIESRNN